jgi:hypothetical protein
MDNSDYSETKINSKKQSEKSLLLEKEEENDNSETKDLFLNPIQKYSIYNQFPYGLLIHIGLIIFTSFEILTLNTSFQRTQKHLIYQYFMDKEEDKLDFDYKKKKYLFSIEDITNVLNQSLTNYYNIINSVENIIYENGKNPPNPYLIGKNLRNKKGSNSTNHTIYYLKENDFGPFNNKKDSKNFIQNISYFNVNYTIYTIFPLRYADHLECNRWDVIQHYSFQTRGIFLLTLKIDRQTCKLNINKSKGNKLEIFQLDNIWLHLIVIFLSLSNLFLTFYTIYKKYFKLNLKNIKEIEIKTLLFKGWTFISLLGNSIQIFGSIMSIFDREIAYHTTELTLSLGCVFSYINLMKYFENFKNYSDIYLAMKRGLPSSINYLIGVLPLFIGYAFFGKCVFWKSDRFALISDSIAVLYSLMNGDSVYDIFVDLCDKSYFFGCIFCYSFCMFSICGIINIFLGIIGEAYVSKKEKKYQHWIYYILSMEREENIKEKERINEEIKGNLKEKTEKKLDLVNQNFDIAERISRLIASKSNTKALIELRSKFNERIHDLHLNILNLKKKINGI